MEVVEPVIEACELFVGYPLVWVFTYDLLDLPLDTLAAGTAHRFNKCEEPLLEGNRAIFFSRLTIVKFILQ